MCLIICLYTTRVFEPTSKECVRFSGTEVTVSGEPKYGCCEQNLGPLQEQRVLLITELFP